MKELRLKDESERFNILKKSIQEGLNSGRMKNFDPKKYLEHLKRNRKANS